MKNNIIYIVFAILLMSSTILDKGNEKCINTFESILKNIDTNRIEIHKYDNKETEILDKKNYLGERGIYKFDENNILRFYGLLVNDSNDCFFHVKYDSKGNEISRTKSNVVRWYVKKTQGDSLKIMFYLYPINYDFSNVQVHIGDSTTKPLFLRKSEFLSNLVGNIIYISSNKKYSKIYLSGVRINACSGQKINFIDSVSVPLNLLN